MVSDYELRVALVAFIVGTRARRVWLRRDLFRRVTGGQSWFAEHCGCLILQRSEFHG